MTPAKGSDTLVRAAARLSSELPRLRLRLVGRVEDAFRRDLLRSAAGTPLELGIVGHLDRTELASALASADVFALPSRFEAGPGFAFLEAMSCGLPVIGPSGGAIGEVVRDGVTGSLVPPGDEDALAAALRRYLADPEERSRAGFLARADAEARWSTADRVQAVVDVYARVVGDVRARFGGPAAA